MGIFSLVKDNTKEFFVKIWDSPGESCILGVKRLYFEKAPVFLPFKDEFRYNFLADIHDKTEGDEDEDH